MHKRQKKLVRLLALVLAALLVLSAVVSIFLTSAHAKEVADADRYTLDVEFFEEEQALRIRQRLVYTNRSGERLDRVEFSVYGNMFRRQSALMYETDALADVLPAGYVPGGMALAQVLVNGEAADWGMVGESELFLRVACDLESGETCEFFFDYTLLLTQNAASLGVGENDWRLRGFYMQALRYENGAFVATDPLQHTNYVYAGRADYELTVTLPERYLLAGPGDLEAQDNGDGTCTWTLSASDLRELCVSVGMRWREYTGETTSGTRVRVLAASRSGGPEALETALEALEIYEGWFGALAWDVTIAQSDYALEALSLPGLVWANEGELFDDLALRRALARQFFGYGAYAMPTQDAWLSEVTSEYAAYLVLEETEGREAFLEALNGEVLPSAQFMLPGGLEITSDASLFSASEYTTIVRERGTLVMHEMRVAMGREALLEGLRLFYQRGLEADVMGEYDLVYAFDDASGRSWEAFLTDWLFNVADYYQESYTIDAIE